MIANSRPAADQVLTDIADYVLNYQVRGQAAVDCARLCMTDTIACGLDALDFPECMKLVGPIVPGIVVAHGARVPGTRYELDPATAAFSFGCLIRWLDFNDQFGAAQGSHPSDNLAGVLMLADYLSRQRLAAASAPLLIADVLDALIKAYEIQGCIAMENDFNEVGIDHPVMTRVASTAVLTRMLGGTREQVINAVSNAWIDTSLAVFRHEPNTGWRKSWSAADAVFQAMRLAFMAVKGEMGYPSVLTAKHYGFHDARFKGQPLKFPRPYDEYVIQHSTFKLVTAGMHGQSAFECAYRLHPLVKHRLDEVERIEIHSHRALMRIMNKSGPLHNPADRDHCVQYIVAVTLIQGQLNPRDFEDSFAADPRIDQLRAKMTVTEEPRFSSDYFSSDKRSNANAVQVHFKDGSVTPKVEIEYPAGHIRRRSEASTVLKAKLASALARRFPAQQSDRILAAVDDAAALDRTPVNEFIDLFRV